MNLFACWVLRLMSSKGGLTSRCNRWGNCDRSSQISWDLKATKDNLKWVLTSLCQVDGNLEYTKANWIISHCCKNLGVLRGKYYQKVLANCLLYGEIHVVTIEISWLYLESILASCNQSCWDAFWYAWRCIQICRLDKERTPRRVLDMLAVQLDIELECTSSINCNLAFITTITIT